MKRTSRRSSRNQSGQTAPAGQQRPHCPVVRVRQRWREMSTPGLPTNLAFRVQREIGTPAYSAVPSTEVSRAGAVMSQGHPHSAVGTAAGLGALAARHHKYSELP